MSKHSPYRKPYKQDTHANTYMDSNARTFQKNRNNRASITDHPNQRYLHEHDENYPRPTEKKKYEQPASTEIELLIQKNKALAAQNNELYMMLEQRGKIIVALERKLQQQMIREADTLQAIEYEKNKFINDSQRRFKQYERKIEELIQQIYMLNEQKYKMDMLKARELDQVKETFVNQQMAQLHQLMHNQNTAREHSQLERMRTKNLLQVKNNELDELATQYRNYVDKLKTQIIGLNNQIVHLNHMRKIQLSQQNLTFQNAIDALKREHLKQKQLMTIQSDLQFKKMEQLLVAKDMEVGKLGEQRTIGQIEQNIREEALVQKKIKLQNQISQLQEFHRKVNFSEKQKLKELNKNEIQALETGNEAFVSNLNKQNAKLIQINNAKIEQINKLYQQIANLRVQHLQQTKNLQKSVQNMKMKLKYLQSDHSQQEERMKVKLAQLRQADITTLKKYYQHQIDSLSHQLQERTSTSESNRHKLHQQLQEKNQMRKRFDIEVLKLNTRIAELQLRIDELQSKKKEDVVQVGSQMIITSTMLLRQTKEKEKFNITNQEEKRRLQQLIIAKDKQIQELNKKIELLKDNNSKEIAHKLAQIQLIKKSKEDVEQQLKKQKYFYDNQLKRKELTIKNNRQFYQDQVDRLKINHRQQYDTTTSQLSSNVNKLEAEINKAKALQKILRNQISNLQKQSNQNIEVKEQQLIQQKDRLLEDKKQTENKLKKYFKEQMEIQDNQIAELKKQLAYKQEDIRAWSQKYHILQQKLVLVMQSQLKLTNMENRIIAMGQDNNLIKNMAQMIQPRRK